MGWSSRFHKFASPNLRRFGKLLSTNRVVEWVAMHVVPAEPRVRAWLQAQGVSAEHADDLVQEAYCRIAALATVDHIARADSYLFTVVRNLSL